MQRFLSYTAPVSISKMYYKVSFLQKMEICHIEQRWHSP